MASEKNYESARGGFESTEPVKDRLIIEPGFLKKNQRGEYVHYWAQQLWVVYLSALGLYTAKTVIKSEELKIDDG